MKNFAYIGIGSNKGDRFAFIEDAIEKINSNHHCEVKSMSSIYESRPLGNPNQENFLNGVIKIETEFSPVELFECLKRIEKELGRKGSVRWGEREIDLDILFYNDLIYQDEKITIPHIGIAERDFVLTPLEEIAPEFVHPVLGSFIKDLSTQISTLNIINKIDSELLLK